VRPVEASVAAVRHWARARAEERGWWRREGRARLFFFAAFFYFPISPLTRRTAEQASRGSQNVAGAPLSRATRRSHTPRRIRLPHRPVLAAKRRRIGGKRMYLALAEMISPVGVQREE